uniref:Uncharacterized protein n=1 Tax=Romanomermis culicivorax TaxID=13658 RepID=A0A915IE50_ROMCU
MAKYCILAFLLSLHVLPYSHAGGAGQATITRPTPGTSGSCGSPLTGDYALLPRAFFGSKLPSPICQKCLLINHGSQSVTIPIKGVCDGCQDEDVQVTETTLRKLEPGAESIPRVFWSIYPCP